MSKYNRKQKNPAKQEDEFVSFWQKAFQQIAPYAQRIGVTVATAVAILFVVWGVSTWLEHRTQAAAEQFSTAVKVYEAELLPASGDPPKTKEGDPPRFKTEKERADAALAELDKLDKEYGGTKAAKSARLIRGAILFDLGRYDDAAQAYEKALAEASTPSMRAVASEGLGLCDEARNKLDDALTHYKQMEPREGAGDFGRDRALYNQGRVLLKKGDKKGALEAYKQALAKVPTTTLKDEIQTQVMLIEGGGNGGT